MPQYPLIQVDAFADRPFTGNPAAVVPLEEWLADETLQAIAAENNLSETAFAVPTGGEADYDLRWFTPTTEVALCGHATLASGHVLLGERAEVRFRTRHAGVLIVSRDGDGYALDLPETRVAPSDEPELLAALGLPEAQAFISISGAEATAIILVEDEAALRACAPDMRALGGIELMAIVTAPGSAETDVVSRVFVPAWGVDEDPVTGSAHAALTPFWCERLGRDSFTAFQASRRGGRLSCRPQGDRVILGGRCVTVIEGRLLL
jgi:PhzF family phenazine biosynthesis protein